MQAGSPVRGVVAWDDRGVARSHARAARDRRCDASEPFPLAATFDGVGKIPKPHLHEVFRDGTTGFPAAPAKWSLRNEQGRQNSLCQGSWRVIRSMVDSGMLVKLHVTPPISVE